MAPHHSSSDSESSDGEDAPETISLAQSKKDIQKLDAELKKAEIAARKNKKSQNREMDRKLKERADMNRVGKQKGEDDENEDEVGRLEARMYRAMQDAQEEMDVEGESGSVGDSEKDDEDEEEQEDDSSLEGEEDEEEEEEEEEEAEILPLNPLKKKTHNANHLPDELFAAAFASKASTSKRKAPDDDLPKQTSKKPKRPHTPGDLIVGSRAIRMLPTQGQPITPSAVPSSKINKFLNRSLALKGGRQHSKTWERRTANIGVLRRDGPASNFVRNR